MNLTERCAQQALATAERLLAVENVLAATSTQDSASLAGLAGTALLHARLATIDPVFQDAAVRHWTRAATHARREGPGGSAGIFANPGGLAASLIIGSAYLPDPDQQRESVAHSARWLSTRATGLAHRHRDHLGAGALTTPWHVYDVINGLAGTGRVLLAAVASGHTDAEPGLLTVLDTLTTMIFTRNGARPGWWLAADDHPHPVTVSASGAATTGLAHGIAGPLALLAVAHATGYSVPGQSTAIRDAAHWLLRWRTTSTSFWPPYVTGDELDQVIADPVAGRHDAWCYGTPGISRALTMAGSALNDPELKATGAEAITSLADRPSLQWDAEGPTLCHGYAGVLQCATTAPATASPAAAAVTAAFDMRYAFGFQHLHDTVAVDEPGLLIGAAGTALALADHGGLPAPDVPARWDAALLLS